MAIDPTKYQQQGQSYAAGLAASQNPIIDFFKNSLGSMKDRAAIASEVANLFNPAVQAAGQVGTNVANVAQATTGVAGGLASALGLAPNAIADAARTAARAGGSAALLGSTLAAGAQGAMAESTMGAQQRSDDLRLQTQQNIAEAEARKAQIAADWLGSAQGLQGMATDAITAQGQALANKRTAWEMANLDPLKVKQAGIDIATGQYNLDKVLPGQVASTTAGTRLTQAQTRQVRAQIKSLPLERQTMALNILDTHADVATKIGNLKKAGFSDKQIKAMMRGYGAGSGRSRGGSSGSGSGGGSAASSDSIS